MCFNLILMVGQYIFVSNILYMCYRRWEESVGNDQQFTGRETSPQVFGEQVEPSPRGAGRSQVSKWDPRKGRLIIFPGLSPLSSVEILVNVLFLIIITIFCLLSKWWILCVGVYLNSNSSKEGIFLFNNVLHTVIHQFINIFIWFLFVHISYFINSWFKIKMTVNF